MTGRADMEPTGPRWAFVASHLTLGGSTTWLCDLAGELRQRGIPVLVCSLRHEHPLAAEFRDRGVAVVVFDKQRLINEDRLHETLRVVRDFRPTVVVAWTGEPSDEVLRYVPPGVLRVGVLHSDCPPVYRGAQPYEPFMDRIVVLSHGMAEAAQTWFRCPASKLMLNRLGVHVAPLRQPRDPVAGRSLRILYLGRVLQHQKRVRLFPEILRELCATGMPFEWTIAGDGADRAFLEQTMVTDNPAQIVRIVGPVAYAKIPGLLAAHDVFLLASEFEGLPHTLLEAMGHGLVPVVSDLPSGIREVVDATTGLLVDVNDIAGYARAIHWLHTHRREMAPMALAAEQRVRENFSVAAMTDQWLAMVPTVSPSAVTWPSRFQIKVPLVHDQRWQFYEPFRTVRRLVKRFTSRRDKPPASAPPRCAG